MKKLLATLLAFVMVFSMTPVSVFSAGGTEPAAPVAPDESAAQMEDAAPVADNAAPEISAAPEQSDAQDDPGASGDGTNFGVQTKLENPVTLGEEGQQVWSGVVDFDKAYKSITFVFRVTGVEEDNPIVATKVNPTLINNGVEWDWTKSSNTYEWNSNWGDANTIFAPEMTITQDGIYYLYLNTKVLCNGGGMQITGARALNLFNKQGTNKRADPSNTNEHAYFEMLAIVPNDLQPTVTFLDQNESELTTQQAIYTAVGDRDVGGELTGINDGVNPRKAKQFLPVKTPTELYQQQSGKPLPEPPAGQKLVWVDDDGEEVEGIYQSQTLHAKFETISGDSSVVTFLKSDGSVYSTRTVRMGESISMPEGPGYVNPKDGYLYTFLGWSQGTEEPLHEGDYTPKAGGQTVTFYPRYRQEKMITANLSSDHKEFSFVSAATKEQTNKLTVTVTLSDSKLDIKDVGEDGKEITNTESIENATVNLDCHAVFTGDRTVKLSRQQDGTFSGTAELTIKNGFVGTFSVSVAGGTAETAGTKDVKIYPQESLQIKVTGQQPGLYIQNPTSKRITNTDESPNPSKQTLWGGDDGDVPVPVDNGHAISYVFKLDGVDTPINAYQLAVGYNGLHTDTGGGNMWFFNSTNDWPSVGNPGSAPSPRFQTFEENGYYVLYLNNKILGTGDQAPINSIDSLSIFAHATVSGNGEAGRDETPENTNDNAEFTMLAVVADELQPTLTFHTSTEDEGSPYTHKYVEALPPNPQDGTKTKQLLKLKTVAEIFAESKIDTPAGEGGKVFVGWSTTPGGDTPADENPVYMNMDLYPVFKEVGPVTVSYTDEKGDGTGTEKFNAGDQNVTADKDTMTITLKTPTADKYDFGGWEFTDNAPAGCALSEDGKQLTITLSAFEGTEIQLTAKWYVPESALKQSVKGTITQDAATADPENGKYTTGLNFKWHAEEATLNGVYDKDLENAKILAFGFIYSNTNIKVDDLLKADIAKQNYEVTTDGDYEWKVNQPSSTLVDGEDPTGYYCYVAGKNLSYEQNIASQFKFTMKNIPKNETRYVMPFVTLLINGKTYVITADETTIQSEPENG